MKRKKILKKNLLGGPKRGDVSKCNVPGEVLIWIFRNNRDYKQETTQSSKIWFNCIHNSKEKDMVWGGGEDPLLSSSYREGFMVVWKWSVEKGIEFLLVVGVFLLNMVRVKKKKNDETKPSIYWYIYNWVFIFLKVKIIYVYKFFEFVLWFVLLWSQLKREKEKIQNINFNTNLMIKNLQILMSLRF